MHDPLHNIHHYSPALTIAQVLKFCEKKELHVTRPMVQNYIRDGLLPPPAGRIYTHHHLAALVMIDLLKTVYDMPAIKAALVPHYDATGLPPDTYRQLLATLWQAHQQWQAQVNPALQGNSPADAALLHMVHVAQLKQVKE